MWLMRFGGEEGAKVWRLDMWIGVGVARGGKMRGTSTDVLFRHRHAHPRPSDALTLRTRETGVYRCGPSGYRNGLLR